MKLAVSASPVLSRFVEDVSLSKLNTARAQEATTGPLMVRGRCKVAKMMLPSSFTDLVSAASDALTGERWAIDDAVHHVPGRPGLYAIYGDETAWNELDLSPTPEAPLYIGKAERSLVSRDLNGHFAAVQDSKARTGGSTVRRSFAALLRDPLHLRAVPRNLANPRDFANYGLAEGGDDRLTKWMHARLALAVWPAPADMPNKLDAVETAVIHRFTPPINLAKNPGRLARLILARAAMASEAAGWRAAI